MLNFIQAIAMAQANNARIKRILTELDEPVQARLREARLTAKDFLSHPELIRDN
jgi:hypothetical protein